MPKAKAFDFPKDPLGYLRSYLGAVPFAKQVEIIAKLRTPPYKVLVRAGHNVGKTWVAGALCNWHFDNYDPSLTITTAPTQHSVQDLLWRELRQFRKDKKFLAPYAPRLYHHESHWVQGYTANKGESFAGRHAEHLLLVYDEATGIDPIFFEVGKTMFAGVEGHGWLCLYNPTDAGSQVYHEESSAAWHQVTISQLDHPNIKAELEGRDPPYPSAVRLQQVIDQLNDYGTRLAPDAPAEDGDVVLREDLRWRPGPIADIRVLGRWPRTGSRTVWSDALWNKMARLRVDLNPRWKVQIGCDVAAYGDDETTFVVKQGICVLLAERHNGMGPRKATARLKELCHRFHGPHLPHQVPCLIDAPGVGVGVWDYAEGYHFIPVQPGAAARDATKYHNTRSELWFNAREHAEADLVDISRLPEAEKRRLKAELTSPTYGLDPGDRLRVEPKPETKNKLKRSPDLADGFNLSCYWTHDL